MNTKLINVLNRPIRTILDVRVCFDYCMTLAEVNTVINRIPKKFGKFEILQSSEESFVVKNFFDEQIGRRAQTISYEFYKGGSSNDR